MRRRDARRKVGFACFGTISERREVCEVATVNVLDLESVRERQRDNGNGNRICQQHPAVTK